MTVLAIALQLGELDLQASKVQKNHFLLDHCVMTPFPVPGHNLVKVFLDKINRHLKITTNAQ